VLLKEVLHVKFSTFLKKIYKVKNTKISLQGIFVLRLFQTCSTNFSYTEDYCKKLLNGSKPLNEELRSFVSNESNYDELPKFFEEHINKNHLIDLLDEFEIADDIKKDYSIFAEALAIQFENYIKYGEENLPTSVNSIYEILIDQYGNGAVENSNEKALAAAKQYLYHAITSLSSIRVQEDILTLQEPFESFFSNIYKAFRVYESKCNLDGKEIYKYVLNKLIEGKEQIDDYLKRASEIGALPIELTKEIQFTIYDNYKFDDKDIELSIQLFEKNEQQRILDEFKKLEFYPVNEIFFTQRISFRIEGQEGNIMDQAFRICFQSLAIFESIELNIDAEYPVLKSISKKIIDAIPKLELSTIQYVVDGTYFPEKDIIDYAPSVVMRLVMKDGSSTEGHLLKRDMSTHPYLCEKAPLEVNFKGLFHKFNDVWKISGHDGMAIEFYTFNRDKTFRHHLVQPTSKARIYRLIREQTHMVYHDDIIGFMYMGLVSQLRVPKGTSMEEISKMTSDERIAIGHDVLVGYGFYDNEKYSFEITKEDSLSGKEPVDSKFDFRMFTPLIRHIHFNDFYYKNKDRIEKELKEKKSK